MKKLIIFFLCMISIFSYAITYKQFEQLEWINLSEPTHFTNFQFDLPEFSLISDPETIYPIIQKTAEEFNVNIFRTAILSTEENVNELNYYVFLTADTKLFQNVGLIKGRYLNCEETQSGNLFLSSKNTGDPNQIGRISVFGKKNTLTIHPLFQSYYNISVFGNYYVESRNQIESTIFYQTLAKNFNETFNPVEPFLAEDFISKENNQQTVSVDLGILFTIQKILTLLIALLIFYYILHQGKLIAIHKMHGRKNVEIWLVSVGKLLFISFSITLVLIIVLSLLQEGYHFDFIMEITMQHIKTFSVIIVLSTVGLLYIMSVKISSILKNRKDTKFIIVCNLLVKIGLFITSLFVMMTILEQLKTIDNKEKVLDYWKESSNYGVFYPFSIGLDEEDLKKKGGARTFQAISKLYEILNQKGSLLIHAKYYEQEVLNLPFNGIRYISVNPNYLKEFPIVSEENEIIHVEESIQHQLLLVPSKYKDKEQEILNFFNQNHHNNIEYDENLFNSKVPEYLSTPNFKIIWMKDQQKIFSFNPEVFPTEGNRILDPIIQVITENNSLTSDKSGIYGGGATDPLKVKVAHQDTALTLKKLKPTLQELQLDDNFKFLISINHLILKELSDLKQARVLNIFILMSIIFGMVFILVQNTILMYYKYQKLFTVRSLFGTGLIKTYQNILYTFCGTWLVQFIIFLFIHPNSMFLTFIIFILFLVEFVLTITTISIIEKKNKVRILKGGL